MKVAEKQYITPSMGQAAEIVVITATGLVLGALVLNSGIHMIMRHRVFTGLEVSSIALGAFGGTGLSFYKMIKEPEKSFKQKALDSFNRIGLWATGGACMPAWLPCIALGSLLFVGQKIQKGAIPGRVA